MADTTKVRIAVASSRELEFEVEDPDQVIKAIEDGIQSGSSLVWVVDSKGHRHGIRVQGLAFVEVDDQNRKPGVGF